MLDPSTNAVATRAPADALLDIVRGYRYAQALTVAATLGVADLLADGPRTVDELAEAAGAHAPSLLRLLRALASIGIFAEEDGRRFQLTPLAEPLRTDAPRSVRGVLRLFGDPIMFVSWGHLLHSVRTGRPAFDHVFGTGMYGYLAQHAEASDIFNAGMAGLPRHAAVLEAYDFSPARVVVDVGGGNGRLIAAILQAHPAQRGILYDLPEVVAAARERFERDGLSDRCELIGGSFLEGVPVGGDLYVLSDVLHNWDDDHVAIILANCRQAVPDDGRLLIIQEVLSESNDQPIGRFADLNMLVLLGGRERTADDFRRILSESGFTLTRIQATRAPYRIIEAIPAHG